MEDEVVIAERGSNNPPGEFWQDRREWKQLQAPRAFVGAKQKDLNLQKRDNSNKRGRVTGKRLGKGLKGARSNRGGDL